MFYISEISLTDIRCFSGEETFQLPPPRDGSPSWTLIVGENGTGKTTVLRSIALCLCDETRASGLFTELQGDMIRQEREEAKIKLTLASKADAARTHTIETTFRKNGDEGEDLKQTRIGSDLSDLLVCGYGAKRGTVGTAEVERYRTIDSVYSLFNYDAQLQSSELVLLRIAQLHKKDITLNELLRNVDFVLGLQPGSTTWDHRGLRVRGPWGGSVGTGAIADGYAATLTWICDLLGWSYFASPVTESRWLGEQIEGIVLLDEIEQHLHPSWQLAMVPRLAKAFPAVQFIATTHSPLVAIGSAAIPAETVLLNYTDSVDGVEMVAGFPSLAARRADQVLTSSLFGLERTTGDRVGRDIERYADLQAKALNDEPLTDGDQKELNVLRDSLAETFSPSETALAKVLARWNRQDLSAQPDAAERGGLREILKGLE